MSPLRLPPDLTRHVEVRGRLWLETILADLLLTGRVGFGEAVRLRKVRDPGLDEVTRAPQDRVFEAEQSRSQQLLTMERAVGSCLIIGRREFAPTRDFALN